MDSTEAQLRFGCALTNHSDPSGGPPPGPKPRRGFFEDRLSAPGSLDSRRRNRLTTYGAFLDTWTKYREQGNNPPKLATAWRGKRGRRDALQGTLARVLRVPYLPGSNARVSLEKMCSGRFLRALPLAAYLHPANLRRICSLFIVFSAQCRRWDQTVITTTCVQALGKYNM